VAQPLKFPLLFRSEQRFAGLDGFDSSQALIGTQEGDFLRPGLDLCQIDFFLLEQLS
jgi:hypothetical protein